MRKSPAAALYLGGRAPTPIKDRVVIVIDDGIATGATTRAALRAIRSRQPKKLILAVPVGPTDTIEAMREEADEVHCLKIYADFGAIGEFYEDFSQTTDQEVIDILAKYPPA